MCMRIELTHLHLNCSIPGTSANLLSMQAYLIEDIVQWNENREKAAIIQDDLSYNYELHTIINTKSTTIFGKNNT